MSRKERINNCIRYNDELDHMELCPNGDDYNAIIAMLCDMPYRSPRKEGR
jgi:hypothetical protein